MQADQIDGPKPEGWFIQDGGGPYTLNHITDAIRGGRLHPNSLVFRLDEQPQKAVELLTPKEREFLKLPPCCLLVVGVEEYQDPKVSVVNAHLHDRSRSKCFPAEHCFIVKTRMIGIKFAANHRLTSPRELKELKIGHYDPNLRRYLPDEYAQLTKDTPKNSLNCVALEKRFIELCGRVFPDGDFDFLARTSHLAEKHWMSLPYKMEHAKLDKNLWPKLGKELQI